MFLSFLKGCLGLGIAVGENGSDMNGRAERKHRHITETSLAMMFNAHVPASIRIYTTCHAQFDETYFPFSSTSLATPSVKILLSTYYDGIPMSTDQPTETSSQSCDQPVSKSPFTTPCDLCQDDPIMTSRSFVELSTPPLVPSPSSSSSTHLMVTRSNADIFTPRHFADLSYVTSSTLHQVLFAAKEPKGFKSAAKHPKWFAAICDEMAALRQNATWDLFKARLVAQGFTQVLGLDYSATFSPIVKASTIRIVLSLIVLHKWLLHQSDVKMREMQENEKKQGKKGSECNYLKNEEFYDVTLKMVAL
ncbi:retrovirus-related pol polyprotein from transposon RE1 [Tanacetum coccineum]